MGGFIYFTKKEQNTRQLFFRQKDQVIGAPLCPGDKPSLSWASLPPSGGGEPSKPLSARPSDAENVSLRSCPCRCFLGWAPARLKAEVSATGGNPELCGLVVFTEHAGQVQGRQNMPWKAVVALLKKKTWRLKRNTTFKVDNGLYHFDDWLWELGENKVQYAFSWWRIQTPVLPSAGSFFLLLRFTQNSLFSEFQQHLKQ